MDEQASTIDGAFGQPNEPFVTSSEPDRPATPAQGPASWSGPSAEGKVPNMFEHPSSEEAPAASLVGSLAAFTLSDILSMLASTKQTGELHVVSETADGKLWLADGELSNAHVGAATTIGQAVFELACVAEGWFYFTVGVVSSSGQPTVPVGAVLNEVRPQVDEWREIRHDIPLEAVVTLAPEPPGQDVQIRTDQWRVLTTVGTTGLSVKEVLDRIGADQIGGLRTLRDLRTAGLIELHGESDDDRAPILGLPAEPRIDADSEISSLPAPPVPPIPAPSVADDVDLGGTPPPPPESVTDGDDGHQDGLAQVTIMPPPIADDPWSPSVDSSTTGSNGVA
jgi:Domain of unknown function (DUF4388)